MFLKSILSCASQNKVSDPSQNALNSWIREVSGSERGDREQLARLVKIEQEGKFSVSADDFRSYLRRSKISSLPAGLTVLGDLNLCGSTGLTSLPAGLTVDGNLYLSNCTGLTSLPAGLTVDGDLYLINCTGLTSLPTDLNVGGNLNLCGCTGLTSLPAGLNFRADLYLSSCTGLTSLPAGLTVRRNLYLSGSTGLTSLPADLTVGGDLYLGGCIGLTSLSNDIVDWGPHRDGGTRHIYLYGSGISYEIFSRLGNPQGMRFHFSMPVDDVNDFPNLEAATDFWKQEAHSDTKIDASSWSLSSTDERNLISFLSKLKGTADYRNINSRELLAKRLIQTLEAMNADSSIRSGCIERVSQGIESCGDRVIFMMNQMELLIHVNEAEHQGADALEELALDLARLEVIHQQAAQKITTLSFVDEIEVYLAYEVEIAKHLNLPISTQNMLYRGCAHVDDTDITRALSEAKRVRKGSAAHNNFLNSWEPWQKNLRKSAIEELLRRIPITDQPSNIEECLITGCSISNVLYLKADSSCIPYEYSAMTKWWIEKGTNPATGKKIGVDSFQKDHS